MGLRIMLIDKIGDFQWKKSKGNCGNGKKWFFSIFGIFLGIALSNIASGILSIIFTKFTAALHN